MTVAPASVVYLLPDKLGGVLSIVANLLSYRRLDEFRYGVVLTDNRLERDTRFAAPVGADWQTCVQYSLPLENLRAVLRRVARQIPPGPGVLVSNDWLELAVASCYDFGRTLIQIVHGDYDYYYDLAVKHEAVIDAYVAYSRRIYSKLLDRLPARRESIFHLPIGIPVSQRVRSRAAGPLRLCFVGRVCESKGVFDLPRIDRLLHERGIAVRWTIIGDGPEQMELRRRWGEPPHVRWLGRRSNAEVLECCADQDVFVLPTWAEGFPVTLLETMSVGLVPVITHLPSGIPEIVTPGVTGYLPAQSDVEAFAAAIVELDRDRDRLEAMSQAARREVVERFDIRERADGYQALYARWRELRRPRPVEVPLHYGSRLDLPWLPNSLVYALRAGSRWWRRRSQRAKR